MNVEINFLDKQEKSKLPLVILGVTFFLLIAAILSVFFFQKFQLEASIESKEISIEKLDSLISENQEASANYEQLKQLKVALDKLQEELYPTLPLYYDVLELLNDSSQIINYTNVEANQFIITANFTDLDEVADYVSTLLNKEYITDIRLTGISSIEQGYEALLTVNLNGEDLLKEFKEDE